MNRLAGIILALAIFSSVIIPGNAQTDGASIRNALVVVTEQDESELQRLLDSGGSPSNVDKTLEAARSLLSAQAYASSTNTDGSFAVEAPFSAGSYNVSVFATGYVMTNGPETVTVDDTGRAKNLTAFLQPSAVLSGKVTDKEGKPVPGVIVAVGNRHSANYDVTMDDGVYVIDTGLKSGTHYVSAFRPTLSNLSKLQAEFGSLNLPIESRIPEFIKLDESTGYISQESAVQLEQGKLTVLNFELERSDAISGKVTDTAGNAVSGVAVLAFPDSTNDSSAKALALTDAEGHYVLNNDLSNGTYALMIPSIFSKGYSPFTANLTLPESADVNIVLQNSRTIEGVVVNANGERVAGAKILAIAKRSALAESVQEFLAGGMGEAISNSDGSFLIDGGIGDGTYIASASFGDVPSTASVEVNPGSAPAQITLDFTEIISITGIIKDAGGVPIENAVVRPSFASVIASDDDDFAVKSGPQGTFTLTAPVDATTDEKLLVDEITVAAPGYETVTTHVNEAMSVTLNTTPVSSITGTVIAQRPLQPPVEIALSRQGTIVLDYEGAKYEVGVRTNSRIVSASFDLPSKMIDIRLEGIQGSAGMSELIIPKQLLAGKFSVSLDNVTAQDGLQFSDNQTHSVVKVTHDHGLQQLSIQGTFVVPELALPAIAAAVATATILIHRRLRTS